MSHTDKNGRSNKDELKGYQGVPLAAWEHTFMKELEEIIGESIPRYEEDPELRSCYDYEDKNCYFHDLCDFGFVAYEGNLKKLSIIDKRIEFLPQSIGNLSELVSLHLSRNSLKSLPGSIGKLENLKFLSVCYNDLTSLPEEIGQLHSLENIWVMFDKLKDFPESLGNLEQFFHISIIGNPKPFNLAKNLPDHIKKILKNADCSIQDRRGCLHSSYLDEEK